MASTPPSRHFPLISQPPRQESQHLTPVPPEQATPAALKAQLQAEVAKWGPVIKAAGAKGE